MSAVKRALSFFKNPPFSSLSVVFVLADSHKLVWAAACLASGILLHEQIPASALALFAAGLVVLAGMAGLLRRLSLGRAEISNSLTNTPEPTSEPKPELAPEFGPKSPAASLRGRGAIYLVTRRGQLSAACDSQAMLVITLAEPLYPCASGWPLLYVPQTHRGGKRERWLFLLFLSAEQAVPPPLSNLRVQKRSWCR